MTTLQQSAEDRWPEDQATIDAEYALLLWQEDDRDSYHQWLIKERGCIHNLFDQQSQRKRYADEFNRLTSNVTNLYI